jgi:predicted hotdog family 3-hydroxylacyl-ACP dehydratase
LIGRDEIRSLIPHAGSMCLLDSVEQWDDVSVRCSTRTHLDSAHPLRRDGRLAAIHLIEYGAQAMALHGGLLTRRDTGGGAAPGMLIAVRDCVLHVARVDDIDAPLMVSARKLLASTSGWMYQFEVRAGDRTLAQGRVAAMPLSGA